MKEFPESVLLLRRPLVLTDEADKEKLEQMVSDLKEQDAVNRVWQFESKRGVKLEITSNSLALVSTSHKSYRHGEEERFRDVIDSVTSRFYEVTQVPVVNRVGLRYINECPILENSTHGFRDHYTTAFPLDRFPLEDATAMDYKVVIGRGRHKLRYIESLQGEGEDRRLILDFDAWSEKIQPSTTLGITGELHDIISREFRETIKEPIVKYMRKAPEQTHVSQ